MTGARAGFFDDSFPLIHDDGLKGWFFYSIFFSRFGPREEVTRQWGQEPVVVVVEPAWTAKSFRFDVCNGMGFGRRRRKDEGSWDHQTLSWERRVSAEMEMNF